MGTVHARSLEPLPVAGPDFGALGEEAELVEVEPESKQEILENKDVVVQHVHFDGLGRTKNEIIMYEIADVFKARNLIDVMRKSHEAREKLLRLGIFRQVDVLIDTCQGDDALPNGLDVTFEVTELRRLTGSYNTMVGNNEGSMVLGLKFPNLFGRAEKVTFQFSYGTKETSYGLSFFKPRPGSFEKNLSVNIYKVTGQFPWSSLRETDRGISTEFNHAMVIDSRNSSILPKRGALLKINQELAGYAGGDVSFLKEDFEFQLNKQIFWDSCEAIAPCPVTPGPCQESLSIFPVGSLQALEESSKDIEFFNTHFSFLLVGEGPRAHLQRLAECIRWSYGAGIVLRLGNIARLELNYCFPMGVQAGDRICDGVQFGAGIRFL
ncbi:Sorting and assembly machinery component 50 like protein [Turdus rufiventris]|nr:Sorting and assembly machinery component 50 like protein [Turdus rufiventris]